MLAPRPAHRLALVLAAYTAGCGRIGFSPAGQGGVDDAGVDSSDALASVMMCDAGRADLVACWDFERDLADGSQYAAIATSTGSVPSYAPGVTGLSVLLEETTVIAVTPHGALSLSAFTLEMWIRPANLPAPSTRMMIFDHNDRFAISLQENGVVRCHAKGLEVGSVAVAPGAWTHVGCMHDGFVLTTYIAGAVVDMAASEPVPGGVTEIRMGSNFPSGDAFVGALDRLHVWNRALDGAELCRQADAC